MAIAGSLGLWATPQTLDFTSRPLLFQTADPGRSRRTCWTARFLFPQRVAQQVGKPPPCRLPVAPLGSGLRCSHNDDTVPHTGPEPLDEQGPDTIVERSGRRYVEGQLDTRV